LTKWSGREIDQRHEGKVLLLLTVMIGAVIGLVVVAFILVTENLGARMYPAGAAAWRRFAIPVAGSLAAGFLLWRYFPNARGSGIPQTKAALFLNSGMIPFRTALGKFICCSVTLASGLALGREGPSVQIAAGIGSTLGRRLGLSPRSIRALVPISAAAALAAAFNTPIAGVFFALEEILGDLHAPVLGSIALSSATSWTVLHLLLGDEPLFHVPAYELVHPVEFVFYAVLGVAGGFVSVGFVKLLLWLRQRFQGMPASTVWIQPVAGGLLMGILGWKVPEVLGVGYAYVSKALNGEMLLTTMALLVLLKVVATATSYASGNSGGIFGPALFIGGMLGGAFGGAVHLLLPDYTGSIGAYALVGMGTAFAGVVRVPLTSVIMIFEVTRDYTIVVPLMISNLIAYFISSRYQEEPIYEALQHQDGIYLPGGARDREEELMVGQGSREPAAVLSPGETVASAFERVELEDEAWPVVEDGRLLGMITIAQLSQASALGFERETLASLLDPAALPESVFADDSLDTAMRRMAQAGVKVLPVVSRRNLSQLTGVITLPGILAVYGLQKNGLTAGQATVEEPPPAPVTSLTRIAIALALAIGLAGFLAYYYRAERNALAQRQFQQGADLETAGQFEAAVGKFRSALSISHAGEQRLALARALTEAGHLEEAATAFDTLLRQNPGSGPVNLGMARLNVQRNYLRQAVGDYHRATYGSWRGAAATEQLQARKELIGLLDRLGEREQARAELMAWKTEAPADAAPCAALGESYLAGGDFPAAQTEFRQAARLSPRDAAYRGRVRLVGDIVAMDPSLSGLAPAERIRRSLDLIEATAAALDRRLAGRSGFDNLAALLKAAKRRMQSPAARESSEANVAMAEQLWEAANRVGGDTVPGDEPLNRLMERLTR
jgi:CIC family chloride channel protein